MREGGRVLSQGDGGNHAVASRPHAFGASDFMPEDAHVQLRAGLGSGLRSGSGWFVLTGEAWEGLPHPAPEPGALCGVSARPGNGIVSFNFVTSVPHGSSTTAR